MRISESHTHYLFYLHGEIVEGSDGHPHSATYGTYEYNQIIETFSDLGFKVISEIRPKHASVEVHALKVVDEINRLMDTGIPASQITVLGASKGGIIAATVSHILEHPQLRYIILAGLFPSLFTKDGIRLHGQVLSIHDSADRYSISPQLFFDNSPGLTRYQSVITFTGLGHGLIFRPYPIWVEEVVAWTGAGYATIEETLSRQRGSRY
ncbi:MAG: hypothetical protein JXX14_12385 [Deltaproteobacteria bacterium]|nr:hypothetical protein [Deltaproteobacteria bacterium]